MFFSLLEIFHVSWDCGLIAREVLKRCLTRSDLHGDWNWLVVYGKSEYGN